MPRQFTDKDRKRFWAKVKRGKVNECWLWKAAKSSNGYGLIGMHGKVVGAHRIAYELTWGPIPEQEVVRHTCDNPLCCNPHHLLCGTQGQNVADMWERKRGVGNLGELHPQAKFSDADIRRIRERYARGETSQVKLARECGVSQVWVGQVVRGERRKVAGGPFTRMGRGKKVAA